jgi:hypothetical protein
MEFNAKTQETHDSPEIASINMTDMGFLQLYSMTLTLELPFTWPMTQDPSSLSDPALDLPIPRFNAKIPMFLNQTIMREFPGGNLRSFFQFLYDVYQEPMPVSELEPVLNYPQPHVQARFRSYIEQIQTGGQVVLRRAMMYPNTIVCGIKRGAVDIDWL